MEEDSLQFGATPRPEIDEAERSSTPAEPLAATREVDVAVHALRGLSAEWNHDRSYRHHTHRDQSQTLRRAMRHVRRYQTST